MFIGVEEQESGGQRATRQAAPHPELYSSIIVVTVRPIRDWHVTVCPADTTFRMGPLQKVVVIGGNGFVGMFASFCNYDISQNVP